ncbi:MAG: DUF1570 domain-containing protein [Acidobacteriota bacterium]
MIQLAALLLAAQTGYVPPVLKGVKGDVPARTITGPIPFPDPNAKWIVVRSKHFVFISSAGEPRTRSIAADLETLASALTNLSPQFRSAPDAPTRIFLFTRPRESRPYFEMLLDRRDANVTGVFVSQKSGGAMILNATYSRDDRTPFHELVHYLISNSDSRPPLWLEEGLAEYFSNAEVRNGKLYGGVRLRRHIDILRTRKILPLAKLFSIRRDSDTYNLAEGQAIFYAESWAVVDWLMRNGGRDGAAFYDFLRDVEQRVPVETALQKNYGRSLRDLETSLHSYLLRRPDFTLTLRVPPTEAATEAMPLDRAGLLYELGRFLAHIEEMKDEATHHFRGALEANSRHARSLAGLGRFDEALAADPNDGEIYVDYAESLMKDQMGALAEATETSDIPAFRKARELAQRAIDLGDADARALGALGTSYITEHYSELGPGIAALERAHALLPARTDYALHLFAMYRRTGDRAKAGELFARLEATRNAQVAFAARAVIVRVETGRANELVRQQNLDEAARADLEKQADDYARVAATNRQIEAYNKAIGEVNRGDYAAARKSLKQLIGGTVDADIARDAKKLLAQLEGR